MVLKGVYSMVKNLKYFSNEYEKIARSNLTDKEKTYKYSELMTEMEKVYKIPLLKDEAWERENRKVIAMYRKLSMSREL